MIIMVESRQAWHGAVFESFPSTGRRERDKESWGRERDREKDWVYHRLLKP